mmetsp:Transcript_28262/g.79792  ORF Transcript_28262/g.79792 Transcript_28262/m.79792 type:complete len:82 (+) Transcript_28262:171-416(+)
MATEVVKDERPGCWGLPYVEWVRVAGVFLLLWFCVGLFFAALMAIGLEIRGNQYLSMPPPPAAHHHSPCWLVHPIFLCELV